MCHDSKVSSRRARPTIRLLREDLEADWDTPYVRRALERGDLTSLIPLSKLPHPLIAKAAECVGDDPALDSSEGPIKSAPAGLPLLEIKVNQWRGGVWKDSDDVHWLVCAGLAKGGHEDHDDFYELVVNASPERVQSWKPTEEDKKLLKKEVASRRLYLWKLDVQRLVLTALERVHDGGKERFDISHPAADSLLAGDRLVCQVAVEVTPVRDGMPTDDIDVEFQFTQRWLTSPLVWPLVTSVLAAIEPPEQSWDTDGLHEYSNMGEPGHWGLRTDLLRERLAAGELTPSEPGREAHYTARSHIPAGVIEGKAARALCGAFSVPYQDYEKLPRCAACQGELNRMPG